MAIPAEKCKYSFSDYLSWDESDRAELLDGELIMMAPPARIHQEISVELTRQLANFLEGKRCRVYHAPFAVRLFEQDGDILYPYQLSSGEKQILVILLTVLVQDNRRGVLFMDEPEVSLHVEWQQRLISLIRQLNPNVQIVLTTHSPAVIMDGWLDAVTEVSDITK